MFTFELLASDTSTYACRAGLMSFDNDVRVLLDPSWNGQNVDDILFLEPYLREVNFIILSHTTPEFIGGYVLMCTKFPKLAASIPVYSTVPLNQLGRISTVEFYRSRGILGPLKDAHLDLDDVDEWFDKVVPLKYFQSLSLFDNNMSLTPYNAGHTLGGTFWLITKRLEKVIYAPAWNHSKDSFLNSASFLSNGNPLSLLMRPTALITNTDLGSTMSHRKRTEKFLSLVDATLANGGAVLLPTSVSGRFLELLHLVDQHLQSAPIPVYFLSYSGTKVLSYASTLLEWMSSQMIKEWEEASSMSTLANKNNFPYDPSKVDLLLDPEELIQLSGPKIVFCSGLDIRDGDMSSAAFKYLSQDQNTTIILTEKTHFGSSNYINSQLYDEWYRLTKIRNGTVEDGIAVPLEQVVSLDQWTKEESLMGAELDEFNEKADKLKKQKILDKIRTRKNQKLLNAELDGDDSSDDAESEEEENMAIDDLTQNSRGHPTTANGDVVGDIKDALILDTVKEALDAKAPLDIKISLKLKPRQAMFPYVNTTIKQKFDDYGEVIDPANFQRNEESANTKFIMDSKKKFDDKKKWNVDKNGKKSDNKTPQQNKLTPQEMLNNQVIQKNLDTLFNPRKRVPLNGGSVLAGSLHLKVRCGLSFVDLSGLVDSRSLSIIVSALKPYNLLLLPDLTKKTLISNESNGESNGDSKDTDDDSAKSIHSLFDSKSNKIEDISSDSAHSNRATSLKAIRKGVLNHSGTKASKMKVIDLKFGSPVHIGGDDDPSGLSSFEVKLDESVIDKLQWQKLDGNYAIAKVNGTLELRGPHKKRKTVHDFFTSSSQFTLNSESSTEEPSTTVPKLAVGNIRLPELKKKLLSKNLNAQFKSEGTLVVNNAVAVRKVSYTGIEGDDSGDIVIDGAIGALYYEVKDCIREMLAYV